MQMSLVFLEKYPQEEEDDEGNGTSTVFVVALAYYFSFLMVLFCFFLIDPILQQDSINIPTNNHHRSVFLLGQALQPARCLLWI
jgi:hypothetical protein